MEQLKLNTVQIEQIKLELPGTYAIVNRYSQSFVSDRDKRASLGAAAELLYYRALRIRYPENKVKFDLVKNNWQIAYGADGIADCGFDVRLKGLTYNYLIDCKYQTCLEHGTVNMGLFYASGSEHFALNGKATHTVHLYLAYKPIVPVVKHLLAKSGRPIPEEYTLSMVFVDLARFKSALTIEKGKYSAGPFEEYTAGVSNQRLLNVSVDWLIENGCAMSYKITA